jgi:heme-degrading monooxygenase HmoA
VPLDRIDEAIAWFEATALPPFSTLPGFRGALELVDWESGEGLTVTFWDSAEAREASEAAAASVRSEGATAAGFEILGVERYDVALNTL